MTEDIETDVACIGGGPASAFAAMEILKSRKFAVDIFEEHKEVGVPVNCAGLVSVDGVRKLKIRVPNDCIQHGVKGSIFFSPSGYEFKVSRKNIQALVIDRAKFDKFLIHKVEDLDGKVQLNTKITSIIKIGKQAVGLKGKKEKNAVTIKSKLIIDGEGIRPKFLEMMGLRPARQDNLIPAIQYDIKNVDVNEDYVEIYLGRKVAPGFFAYIIPTSSNCARVAVGSKYGKVLDHLKHFINKHPIASKKLKEGSIIKKGGGFVHIGGPLKKTYAPGFIGIGDAVGHVKATTGGGIIFGGLCAKIAGKIAIKSFENNDFSENFLKKYQSEWQYHYLRELRLMKLVRVILNSLPDKLIDELFLSLYSQGISELIEEIGDMDMQGAIIREVLFGPKFLKIALTMLSGIFLH